MLILSKMSEIMEVEVGEVKMAETRRTSERTRGKRISYNEKIMASYDEVSPVKMRKTHRSNGGGSRKSSKVLEVVEKVEESREMEIVRGLFGASEGGDGLLNLGLKLEEVQSDSRVSVEKSDHLKVKETLRIFNNHYLHFIQVCFLLIFSGIFCHFDFEVVSLF